jgi:hypothetical protein
MIPRPSALALAFVTTLFGTLALPDAGAAQVVHGPERPARDAAVMPVAYFDDGQDKTSIPDLRAARTRGEPLSDAEHAILRAANRIGYVLFPDCRNEAGAALGVNAFLVRIGGRDGVVSSAHVAVDQASRQFHNGCTLEQVSRILYLPNMSYVDRVLGDPMPGDDHPTSLTVSGRLDTSLGGLAVQGLAATASSDYIVMLLDDQISHLPSPDGAVRGAFEFATFPRQGDMDVVMMGADPTFYQRRGRVAASWQHCLAEVNFGQTRHLCDTVPGVSGSVIAVLEDGEYRALALHSSGVAGAQTDALLPLPQFRFGWNTATTTSVIVDALRVQGR